MRLLPHDSAWQAVEKWHPNKYRHALYLMSKFMDSYLEVKAMPVAGANDWRPLEPITVEIYVEPDGSVKYYARKMLLDHHSNFEIFPLHEFGFFVPRRTMSMLDVYQAFLDYGLINRTGQP